MATAKLIVPPFRPVTVTVMVLPVVAAQPLRSNPSIQLVLPATAGNVALLAEAAPVALACTGLMLLSWYIKVMGFPFGVLVKAGLLLRLCPANYTRAAT